MKQLFNSREPRKCIPTWAGMLLSLTLFTGTSVADDTANAVPDLGSGEDAAKFVPHKMTLQEMSAKLDNPVSDLWMLWMQNDHMQFNGDISSKDRTVNVTYFEPVISIPLGDRWNLVNRPVVTRINAQVPSLDLGPLEGNLGGLPRGQGLRHPAGDIDGPLLDKVDWDNEAGWGDLTYLAMISPQTLPDFGKGKLIWGAGITTMWPTSGSDLFGSGKYSAGPAALWMYQGSKWKLGALGQQWWSYAGDSDRESVSRFDAQYFWFYQLPNLWQIGAAPSITANWKADKRNRWTVPLGIGINKTLLMGRLPVRISLEVHKTIVAPDAFGQDWNFRLVFIPIIPNLVKLHEGKLNLP
jgi:hypothetical protein